MLINAYTSDTKFKNFPTLDAEINDYYALLYDTAPDQDYYSMTPRYRYEHGIKAGSRDIFYYIDSLYDLNPVSIIDVGCGECTWKNWFPNIIGFDPTPSKWSRADFVDFFDEDFSRGHAKCWDCGMALNSMHFIDWSDTPKQIDLAMNMVKDQFLFTFNFDMLTNKPHLPLEQLILLFDHMLAESKYKIKLLDYPTLRGISDCKMREWAFLNGHARFILQHKQ